MKDSIERVGTPSPWAVFCCNHGTPCKRFYLTRKQYDAQMKAPNLPWICPVCHEEGASWDDENYEIWLEKENSQNDEPLQTANMKKSKIYYFENSEGNKPDHGCFEASSDEEAICKAPPTSVIIYHESDTKNGEPFIVIYKPKTTKQNEGNMQNKLPTLSVTLKDKAGNPNGLLIGMLFEKDDKTDKNTVEIGWSKCHKKDVFDPNMAMEMACINLGKPVPHSMINIAKKFRIRCFRFFQQVETIPTIKTMECQFQSQTKKSFKPVRKQEHKAPCPAKFWPHLSGKQKGQICTCRKIAMTTCEKQLETTN